MSAKMKLRLFIRIPHHCRRLKLNMEVWDGVSIVLHHTVPTLIMSLIIQNVIPYTKIHTYISRELETYTTSEGIHTQRLYEILKITNMMA